MRGLLSETSLGSLYTIALGGVWAFTDQNPINFSRVGEVWLFDQVILENCKYSLFPKEIMIYLAKAEEARTWTNLSRSSIAIQKDYEFSWHNRRMNMQDIVPPVKNQGQKGTCIFHALTSTVEMESKREAANRQPPESFNLKLVANDFAAEFDKEGRLLGLKEALKFFKEKGVLTRGKGLRGCKYKIKDYKRKQNLRFSQIQKLIKEGRPMVGGFNVDRTFEDLPPGEIYDYDPRKKLPDVPGHAVVFIGYGWRDGRAYLVFLNSYGPNWCSSGFGRVYLDHVQGLRIIDV
ncbi:hypothetical protein C2845_PM09G01940 [Panicum miliaceum]|uniref:Peptidase C1A papain C-terminal domain-containing protein n=1 Tax=Panicum miliaceum TaxID=4540 RepID=A0A3L6RY62_PANMI|nr:hypothetical protein C2845_PM09G01940 [Panicum miliaceum]